MDEAADSVYGRWTTLIRHQLATSLNLEEDGEKQERLAQSPELDLNPSLGLLSQ